SRPAAFKRAWCAWLAGDAAEAAKRFEALVAADGAADPVAEESLAMVAVARHAAGDADAALAAADRYRATHPKGAHLGKTERVASRVLKAKGDLRAAGERLAAAAGAGGASEADVAADRLTSAEIAYRQGDFRRAQSLYREAAERRDAVGAQACEGLAWCAFELGDDGDCEACVDAGLRHPAGESVAPSLRELLVSLRHRQGRFDDAAKAARDYLKRHATHARAAEVRLMLGTAQARADRPKDALRTLHELGRGEGLSRPDLLHYERAWAARKAGDEPSALADFAEVARLSKDDDLAGEARLHLGEAAAAAKETDEARAWFAQVKGRHAARAAYRDAFLRLEGGDVRGAAEVFERLATSSDPALSADAAFLAGDCRLRLSEWDAAARRLARFREAAPDHPNVATALRLQGRAELEAGRPARAIGPLEEFLRRDDGKAPSDAARAWLWLGRAKGETKDAAGAEAAYAKATTLSDGELGAEAQFRLGASRRDRGDLDGACDAWLKLAILYAHPEWASRGLLEAAKTYETQGRKDKAKTLYAEAAERFGATPAGEAARRRRAALGE
ncbi:MAG TPA: tetratricopeptide repeat protein, partial [Planctomycetota bacterium]|nr:tetratricopeptide repeat protein [Planctomycetota bacterium]